jgi:hypothetical protein
MLRSVHDDEIGARPTSMMPQSSARILAVLPVAKQKAIVWFLDQQFPDESS